MKEKFFTFVKKHMNYLKRYLKIDINANIKIYLQELKIK